MPALRQLLANYSLSRVIGKEACADRNEFPTVHKLGNAGPSVQKLMKVDVSAATGPAARQRKGNSKKNALVMTVISLSQS